MKTMIQVAVASAALLALPAIAQATQATQAQQDASAALVTQCVLQKAPKDWDLLTVAIDRGDPARTLVFNVARVKGEQVDIDMTGCDVPKQAHNLSMFQAVVPPSQKTWRVLYLTSEPSGQYRVYTDIGMAQAAVKAK